MSATAAAWALEAARLPLAFAQVREDPRLDLALASTLPAGSKVVMIASGGDTAAVLARLPLNLLLVDMNSAQIALSRLKWRLLETETSEGAAGLLGHLPLAPENRRQLLATHLAVLGLEEGVFGNPVLVSVLGPDQSGRYERTFAELRTRLFPRQAELREALLSPKPLPDFGNTYLARFLGQAFAKVMTLENLVGLFGAEATQNPRRPFSEHFAERTRVAFSTLPPASNPFLWQILAGCFPPGHPYDWLCPETWSGNPTAEACWRIGRMDEVLASLPSAQADLVHLSNILDWLSPEVALHTLRQAFRVLKPGGRVVIRQLNSSLDIAGVPSGFVWDETLGLSLAISDRSYFYPAILVGSRP